jgi:sugar-specific transcriptional regulator TrmB
MSTNADFPSAAPTLAATPVQSSLMELGFSEYEAKAYLGLLQASPANAYEVGKVSGIPSSKIYQVLARLVERGVVLAIEEGGKSSYVPLSPKELVESQRLRMETRLDSLERQLSQPRRDEKLNYIWNFTDYRGLEEQLGLLVRDTRRELILSLWREEAAMALPWLPALRKRGVRTAVILYGIGVPAQLPPTLAPLAELAVVYPHPIEDTLYQERGGRGVTAIADGTRALTATVFSDQSVEGAWSLNRGFVMLAEDYIKHDIYLMKIVERMDDRLTAAFGESYAALRDIFQK